MWEFVAVVGIAVALLAWGYYLGHQAGAGAREVLERRIAELDAAARERTAQGDASAKVTTGVVGHLHARDAAPGGRAGARMLLAGGPDGPPSDPPAGGAAGPSAGAPAA